MKTSAKEIKSLLNTVDDWFATKKSFNEFCKAVAEFKNASNVEDAEYDLAVGRGGKVVDRASVSLWLALVDAKDEYELETAARDLADWASQPETDCWIDTNGKRYEF